MRRGGEAAHVVHQIRHLGELGEGLLDVCRTATAEVAAKRVADVVARAAVDQRARYVGPAQRAAVPAGKLRVHVVEIDGHPEALQLGNDLLAAAPARGPCVAPESLL